MLHDNKSMTLRVYWKQCQAILGYSYNFAVRWFAALMDIWWRADVTLISHGPVVTVVKYKLAWRREEVLRGSPVNFNQESRNVPPGDAKLWLLMSVNTFKLKAGFWSNQATALAPRHSEHESIQSERLLLGVQIQFVMVHSFLHNSGEHTLYVILRHDIIEYTLDTLSLSDKSCSMAHVSVRMYLYNCRRFLTHTVIL